eukprot:TRINITY_DN1461_c3_g1_i1.p1 TRINITY_DN1461_c3_g1~~TRINITY_DN1461_c3_g1_i1.p1  ORF type:complete len:322 (+),score=57.43 TRINITY_DN1461_c3_g1_i1:55-966(+)
MAVREAVGKWGPMLEKALQYDKWGQIVEAMELYTTMYQEVLSVMRTVKEMDTQHRNGICMFQAALQLRLKNLKHHSTGGVLQKTTSPGGPGLDFESMARIVNLKGLIMEGETWPVYIESLNIEKQEEHIDQGADDDSGFSAGHKGYLIPPPKLSPGDRILKIDLISIGLKDAMDYLDPFISVSLRAGPFERQLLETEQHTPHPNLKRDAQAVNFGTTVYIQTPVDKIPSNANVFFELKHYKPKKNKISVRCWSMLSTDEFVEGTKGLEIYAKPTDYSAKKFHKHSKKPLFLNVNLSIVSNQNC